MMLRLKTSPFLPGKRPLFCFQPNFYREWHEGHEVLKKAIWPVSLRVLFGG
jgi:hypothetical protein